jgi:type IV pilus assembly protein PilO
MSSKGKLPALPFEKLEGLKRTQKLGIAAATYVVIAGLMFYFFILPVKSSISTLTQQIVEAKQKIAANDSAPMRKNIAAAPENLARLQNELDISRQLLPEKQQVDRLLKSISTNAQDVGLHVIQFRPLPEPKELRGEFLAEVPFQITVEGSFLEVCRFIYEISRLPRIVRIDSIQLADPRVRWFDEKTLKGYDEKSNASLSLGYDPSEAGKSTRTADQNELVMTAAIKGTTFRVVETSLPVDQVKPVPAAPEAKPAPGAPAAKPAPGAPAAKPAPGAK